jgi:hypothetical protein
MIKFLWNVGTLLPDYIASHPSIQDSSVITSNPINLKPKFTDTKQVDRCVGIVFRNSRMVVKGNGVCLSCISQAVQSILLLMCGLRIQRAISVSAEGLYVTLKYDICMVLGTVILSTYRIKVGMCYVRNGSMLAKKPRTFRSPGRNVQIYRFAIGCLYHGLKKE